MKAIFVVDYRIGRMLTAILGALFLFPLVASSEERQPDFSVAISPAQAVKSQYFRDFCESSRTKAILENLTFSLSKTFLNPCENEGEKQPKGYHSPSNGISYSAEKNLSEKQPEKQPTNSDAPFLFNPEEFSLFDANDLKTYRILLSNLIQNLSGKEDEFPLREILSSAVDALKNVDVVQFEGFCQQESKQTDYLLSLVAKGDLRQLRFFLLFLKEGIDYQRIAADQSLGTIFKFDLSRFCSSSEKSSFDEFYVFAREIKETNQSLLIASYDLLLLESRITLDSQTAFLDIVSKGSIFIANFNEAYYKNQLNDIPGHTENKVDSPADQNHLDFLETMERVSWVLSDEEGKTILKSEFKLRNAEVVQELANIIQGWKAMLALGQRFEYEKTSSNPAIMRGLSEPLSVSADGEMLRVTFDLTNKNFVELSQISLDYLVENMKTGKLRYEYDFQLRGSDQMTPKVKCNFKFHSSPEEQPNQPNTGEHLQNTL